MPYSIKDKQKMIADGLKERGLRMTLPRRAIISTLASSDTYLTAEEIYHKLLETDEAMKVGGHEQTLELDMLIAELTT